MSDTGTAYKDACGHLVRRIAISARMVEAGTVEGMSTDILRMENGMHFVDTLVIALIALAIFGPKTLQSIAKSAGKSAAQAKDMKDKLMAELPMEEVTKFRQGIPQVPLNSRDAMRMLVTPEKPANADEAVKTVTPKTDVEA